MNIFEDRKDFFGKLEDELTNGTLLLLFQLVKQVRNGLGKHEYLLDCYLSLFFDDVSESLINEPASLGFARNSQLQRFFLTLFKNQEDMEDKEESDPFYKKTKELFYKLIDKTPYEKQYIRVCLLILLVKDDAMRYWIADFVNNDLKKLYKVIDKIVMNEVYEQICSLVGRPIIEELKMELKQRFLNIE